MNVICIIQARMGSTRLPGKVLRRLGSKTMLEHVVSRAHRIPGVDEVVVATTIKPMDDPIVSLCRSRSYTFFRGSEENVLNRYILAAKDHDADSVMRITSDCPLIDPTVSGKVLSHFLDSSPDYASNTLKRTWPRGLDTEVVPMDILEQAARDAKSQIDREHVTSFVYKHPKRFRLLSVTGDVDNSHLRWTVDTLDDFKLIQKIFDSFSNDDFSTFDVLRLMQRNPMLATINAGVRQKEI